MKTNCWLLAIILFCQESSAQIVFFATNLPSRVGTDYYRAFVGANVDVSGLLGAPGGPQRWDFSQGQAPGETIRRTDIVAPSDGGHGAGFSSATYAERDTEEASGNESWSYYRIANNVGRIYYGFYDANANAACPRKLFNAPTTDLPDGIHYGQNWTRTVDFPDCLDLGGLFLELAVHFVSRADVDAWGTVVLPVIGEVQTLRVNEINTYVITDKTLGLPIPTQIFRNYYWLASGVGKAVNLISDGSATVPPANLTTAKTLVRVFEASRLPKSVADLCIHLEGGKAVLNWREEANTTGYRVEMVDALSTTPWQLAAEPVTNTWSDPDPATHPQRFYRVLIKPGSNQ